MAHHRLKIEKEYMRAKHAGDKPFEIRINDRDFKIGDTITYTNTAPPPLDLEYEGTWVITYVTDYDQKKGRVVFGDKKIDPRKYLH